MRGLWAPLLLVAARARRRPARWLLPALGVALSVGFAGAIAAEGTITGDQAARTVLAGLSPLQRTVRVTWQGVVTSSVDRQARALLHGFGLGGQTQVLLLNPVRLDGVLVRPAAIAPLASWLGPGSAASPGRCRPSACPMLIAGGARRGRLSTIGARIPIAGSATLASAVPLGFTPGAAITAQPPLLLTGDVTGLDALDGLSGVYRSHDWLAQLPTTGLHSWQLAGLRQRLQRAQASLESSGSSFTMTAPFDGLDAARAQAHAAPRRLLLAGGGALAAFALFVVLSVGALRRDQSADVERLRVAGARANQWVLFVVAESAWLCGVALIAGACLSVVATVVLAGAAVLPAGAVLTHSLITPLGALALVVGWVASTGLVAAALLGIGSRAATLVAVAAAAALVIALVGGSGATGPAPVLLAPLCCVAAGVVTFRAIAALLPAGERIARRGPVMMRLSLVGLARAPAQPSLAIAFVAVSVGLGGFALAYRATLLRGTADQAANAVPLDAIVSPSASFVTPLQLSPLSRWRAAAGGEVLPIRRTDATYTSGGGTVTVPALGVPASGLALLHGWRASDGSASLPTLARALAPPGSARTAGPLLAGSARSVAIRARSPTVTVAVAAYLRSRDGAVRQVSLGAAGPSARTLRASIPAGSWELEALQLTENSGLEITNGHQNGENTGAATQAQGTVVLGPLLEHDGAGQAVGRVALVDWRGVGAAAAGPTQGGAAAAGPTQGAVAHVRFEATGQPGLLRPTQPSDLHPIPVLVDPHTAAASGSGGRLELTVDGQPVNARVVGVLRRFPTVGPGVAGFVVADEARLAGALDAQLPGQGQADELWIATRNPDRLRLALQTAPLASLNRKFRADFEHRLRAAPIARGVLGTLVAATVVAGALAVLGLLVALLGPARDERVERDLVVQGVGPRGLRSELRARLMIAGVLGTIVGLAIAVALTRLAVASVRAADAVTAANPPLVTVAPWGQLAAWALVAIAALAAAGWAAAR